MPSFAIEAVPEAVPLTESTLLDILSRAASSDQQQIKSAAQQLQNWERHPGYYSGLQSIFASLSLPLHVRHLAVITLKNGIDKYWRKTAQHAIKKDEKATIRSRCVEIGVDEPVAGLALQNAIVVAKITRHEFPHDWPDAITLMTQTVRLEWGTSRLPRILVIVLTVVKELATAKLQRSRVSLYGAAPDLFRTLCEVYVERVGRWMHFLQHGGDDEGGAIAAVEHSLRTVRILRRLITAGYQRPADAAEVQELWTVVRSHFGQMYSMLQSAALEESTQKLIEKHVIQIAKLHRGMVRDHPTAFPQLPDAIGIAQSYWGLLKEYGGSFGTTTLNPADIGTDGDEDDLPYMERLSLNALLILRACVKMAYNPAQTFRYSQPHEKAERHHSRETMKESLLSDATIREMMETLVVKFFVFRPRDLHEWAQEPDEWERTQEGEGESWEHSVRLCAEKLFLDLVLSNKDLLVEPLLGVFHSVATIDNTDVLVKDSVYAAIGLSAPILHERLDFDAFLNTLAQEVQIQAPGYNLLRRRIAIVIGQWVTVKPMDRVLVYQIFQHLLDTSDPSNDLVVRLTAGRQLGNVMDPWDIRIQEFAPFAATILQQLLNLIREVPIVDTQLDLLSVLSTIVTRMEHHISPFASQILDALPTFWESAADNYLPKQTILGIIAALMNAIGAESTKYHHLILPIVVNALEPESETRLYLLEDALDLWSAVLTQASEPTHDLLALTPYLQPIFESASENLAKALEIEELYAVLHPNGWVENATERFGVYTALLHEKLNVATRAAVLRIVELVVQQACHMSQVEYVLQCMYRSSFLVWMLAGLRSAYDAHQTTGPNRLQSSIDDPTETSYLAILSRTLLAETAITVTAVGAEDWEWLMPEWFQHFESIPSSNHKKICCMGLTSLLRSELQGVLLGRLQEMLSVWTDVTYECCELEEDGSITKDSLVYERREPQRDPDMPPPQPEELRRQELLYGDPVHVIPIHDFIRQVLQQVVTESGGQEAFQSQWLVNVDKEVVQSFGNLRLL